MTRQAPRAPQLNQAPRIFARRQARRRMVRRTDRPKPCVSGSVLVRGSRINGWNTRGSEMLRSGRWLPPTRRPREGTRH